MFLRSGKKRMPTVAGSEVAGLGSGPAGKSHHSGYVIKHHRNILEAEVAQPHMFESYAEGVELLSFKSLMEPISPREPKSPRLVEPQSPTAQESRTLSLSPVKTQEEQFSITVQESVAVSDSETKMKTSESKTTPRTTELKSPNASSELKSPTKTKSSFGLRLGFFSQGGKSSSNEPKSPVSPGKEPLSPGTEPVSPGTEPVSPGTEPVLPATEPVSPGKEPVSPVSEPVSPGPVSPCDSEKSYTSTEHKVLTIHMDGPSTLTLRSPKSSISDSAGSTVQTTFSSTEMTSLIHAAKSSKTVIETTDYDAKISSEKPGDVKKIGKGDRAYSAERKVSGKLIGKTASEILESHSQELTQSETQETKHHFAYYATDAQTSVVAADQAAMVTVDTAVATSADDKRCERQVEKASTVYMKSQNQNVQQINFSTETAVLQNQRSTSSASKSYSSVDDKVVTKTSNKSTEITLDSQSESLLATIVDCLAKKQVIQEESDSKSYSSVDDKVLTKKSDNLPGINLESKSESVSVSKIDSLSERQAIQCERSASSDSKSYSSVDDKVLTKKSDNLPEITLESQSESANVSKFDFLSKKQTIQHERSASSDSKSHSSADDKILTKKSNKQDEMTVELQDERGLVTKVYSSTDASATKSFSSIDDKVVTKQSNKMNEMTIESQSESVLVTTFDSVAKKQDIRQERSASSDSKSYSSVDDKVLTKKSDNLLELTLESQSESVSVSKIDSLSKKQAIQHERSASSDSKSHSSVDDKILTKKSKKLDEMTLEWQSERGLVTKVDSPVDKTIIQQERSAATASKSFSSIDDKVVTKQSNKMNEMTIESQSESIPVTTFDSLANNQGIQQERSASSDNKSYSSVDDKVLTEKSDNLLEMTLESQSVSVSKIDSLSNKQAIHDRSASSDSKSHSSVDDKILTKKSEKLQEMTSESKKERGIFAKIFSLGKKQVKQSERSASSDSKSYSSVDNKILTKKSDNLQEMTLESQGEKVLVTKIDSASDKTLMQQERLNASSGKSYFSVDDKVVTKKSNKMSEIDLESQSESVLVTTFDSLAKEEVIQHERSVSSESKSYSSVDDKILTKMSDNLQEMTLESQSESESVTTYDSLAKKQIMQQERSASESKSYSSVDDKIHTKKSGKPHEITLESQSESVSVTKIDSLARTEVTQHQRSASSKSKSFSSVDDKVLSTRPNNVGDMTLEFHIPSVAVSQTDFPLDKPVLQHQRSASKDNRPKSFSFVDNKLLTKKADSQGGMTLEVNDQDVTVAIIDSPTSKLMFQKETTRHDAGKSFSSIDDKVSVKKPEQLGKMTLESTTENVVFSQIDTPGNKSLNQKKVYNAVDDKAISVSHPGHSEPVTLDSSSAVSYSQSEGRMMRQPAPQVARTVTEPPPESPVRRTQSDFPVKTYDDSLTEQEVPVQTIVHPAFQKGKRKSGQSTVITEKVLVHQADFTGDRAASLTVEELAEAKVFPSDEARRKPDDARKQQHQQEQEVSIHAPVAMTTEPNEATSEIKMRNSQERTQVLAPKSRQVNQEVINDSGDAEVMDIKHEPLHLTDDERTKHGKSSAAGEAAWGDSAVKGEQRGRQEVEATPPATHSASKQDSSTSLLATDLPCPVMDPDPSHTGSKPVQEEVNTTIGEVQEKFITVGDSNYSEQVEESHSEEQVEGGYIITHQVTRKVVQRIVRDSKTGEILHSESSTTENIKGPGFTDVPASVLNSTGEPQEPSSPVHIIKVKGEEGVKENGPAEAENGEAVVDGHPQIPSISVTESEAANSVQQLEAKTQATQQEAQQKIPEPEKDTSSVSSKDEKKSGGGILGFFKKDKTLERKKDKKKKKEQGEGEKDDRKSETSEERGEQGEQVIDKISVSVEDKDHLLFHKHKDKEAEEEDELEEKHKKSPSKIKTFFSPKKPKEEKKEDRKDSKEEEKPEEVKQKSEQVEEIAPEKTFAEQATEEVKHSVSSTHEEFKSDFSEKYTSLKENFSEEVFTSVSSSNIEHISESHEESHVSLQEYRESTDGVVTERYRSLSSEEESRSERSTQCKESFEVQTSSFTSSSGEPVIHIPEPIQAPEKQEEKPTEKAEKPKEDKRPREEVIDEISVSVEDKDHLLSHKHKEKEEKSEASDEIDQSSGKGTLERKKHHLFGFLKKDKQKEGSKDGSEERVEEEKTEYEDKNRSIKFGLFKHKDKKDKDVKEQKEEQEESTHEPKEEEKHKGHSLGKLFKHKEKKEKPKEEGDKEKEAEPEEKKSREEVIDEISISVEDKDHLVTHKHKEKSKKEPKEKSEDKEPSEENSSKTEDTEEADRSEVKDKKRKGHSLGRLFKHKEKKDKPRDKETESDTTEGTAEADTSKEKISREEVIDEISVSVEDKDHLVTHKHKEKPKKEPKEKLEHREEESPKEKDTEDKGHSLGRLFKHKDKKDKPKDKEAESDTTEETPEAETSKEKISREEVIDEISVTVEDKDHLVSHKHKEKPIKKPKEKPDKDTESDTTEETPKAETSKEKISREEVIDEIDVTVKDKDHLVTHKHKEKPKKEPKEKSESKEEESPKEKDTEDKGHSLGRLFKHKDKKDKPKDKEAESDTTEETPEAETSKEKISREEVIDEISVTVEDKDHLVTYKHKEKPIKKQKEKPEDKEPSEENSTKTEDTEEANKSEVKEGKRKGHSLGRLFKHKEKKDKPRDKETESDTTEGTAEGDTSKEKISREEVIDEISVSVEDKDHLVTHKHKEKPKKKSKEKSEDKEPSEGESPKAEDREDSEKSDSKEKRKGYSLGRLFKHKDKKDKPRDKETESDTTEGTPETDTSKEKISREEVIDEISVSVEDKDHLVTHKHKEKPKKEPKEKSEGKEEESPKAKDTEDKGHSLGRLFKHKDKKDKPKDKEAESDTTEETPEAETSKEKISREEVIDEISVSVEDKDHLVTHKHKEKPIKKPKEKSEDKEEESKEEKSGLFEGIFKGKDKPEKEDKDSSELEEKKDEVKEQKEESPENKDKHKLHFAFGFGKHKDKAEEDKETEEEPVEKSREEVIDEISVSVEDKDHILIHKHKEKPKKKPKEEKSEEEKAEKSSQVSSDSSSTDEKHKRKSHLFGFLKGKDKPKDIEEQFEEKEGKEEEKTPSADTSKEEIDIGEEKVKSPSDTDKDSKEKKKKRTSKLFTFFSPKESKEGEEALEKSDKEKENKEVGAVEYKEQEAGQVSVETTDLTKEDLDTVPKQSETDVKTVTVTQVSEEIEENAREQVIDKTSVSIEDKDHLLFHKHKEEENKEPKKDKVQLLSYFKKEKKPKEGYQVQIEIKEDQHETTLDEVSPEELKKEQDKTVTQPEKKNEESPEKTDEEKTPDSKEHRSIFTYFKHKKTRSTSSVSSQNSSVENKESQKELEPLRIAEFGDESKDRAALDDSREVKKKSSNKLFHIFTPKKKKKEESSTLDSIRFIPIEVDADDSELPEDSFKGQPRMAANEELAYAMQQELRTQNKHYSSVQKSASSEHREEFTSTENRKSIVLTDEMLRHNVQMENSVHQKSSTTHTLTVSSAVPGTSSQDQSQSQQQPHKASPSNAEPALARSHRSSVDSGTGSDPSRPPGHFVVVAIDFGTTFSGYAFCFTRDPDHIHMMRKWEGGDPGVINQKTPTCLLMSPDGTFHSFGFTARDFYHDLDPVEAQKWYFFDKFKMVLHYNAELNKKTTIKATNGKEFSAIIVFSHALRFFKEHALQELSDQSSTKILNEDVRWVLTVPAIWKAPAKQFMRQAAYDAGIASQEYPDQLLIALEPEAASIWCRRLRMYQLVPEKPPKQSPIIATLNRSSTPDSLNMDSLSDEFLNESTCPPIPSIYQASLTLPHDPNTSLNSSQAEDVFPLFPDNTTVGSEVQNPGTRYMVVDCGGGTVDITVHEMESRHGNLKELYKATGGPYGSVGVDIEFENLLNNIFGVDFMKAFKYKRPAGYVDLMIAFESRKRAANPFKGNPLNVSLPFSFIDFYKKYKSGSTSSLLRTSPKVLMRTHGGADGSQVENAIRKYGDKEIRWSSQGMMRFTPEAMRRMFLPTLDRIKQAIGDVLNNPNVKGIQYMFLVGGFSESPMLQQELRKEFGHLMKIIIPQDVGLTILKGAVLFGLDPAVVTIRKSRLTYGVGVLNRFVEGKHPPKNKVNKDGIDWCTDVFDKFVIVDQSVALGDTVRRSYTPAKPGQKTSIINVYVSERSDAEYITDSGVKKCGTLCLDLTDLQYQQSIPKRREIQTRMTFGDTEIKVSALDVATGRCVRAAIDFLNK